MTALRPILVLAALSMGGCFALFELDGYGPPRDPDPDAGAPDAAPIDDADSGDAGVPASPVNYTGRLGEDGGARYDDTCPEGQVMIGAEGGWVRADFYENVLSRFRVICGALGSFKTHVAVERGAVVPDESMDGRGTVAVAVKEVICPANQVVVGFKGRTVEKDFPPPLALTSTFDISCAPLSEEAGKIVIGTAAVVEGVGSHRGTEEGPFDCQPDTVAVGMRVYAGDVVNVLEMRCDLPIVP